MEANLTSEPTEPGFYWLWEVDWVTGNREKDPVIVQIFKGTRELEFYITGSDCEEYVDSAGLWSGEPKKECMFFGPLPAPSLNAALKEER